MATSKKSGDQPDDDSDIERALYDAMCSLGLILPTSTEAVARAEQEMEGNEFPLPASLREPPDFAQCDDGPRDVIPMTPVLSEVQMNLARAAREGKDISPQIEERMRADRRKAEEAKSQ